MAIILQEYKWLSIMACIYFALRAPYFNFIPIWDGSVYYWFAQHALLGRPHIFLYLEPHNHICFLYMLLMALPARINLGSIVQFNLFLTIFTFIGIFAFYKILEYFLRSRVSRAELTLMAAVFAFQPAVLSSTVHFTLDAGLLTVFLLVILCFLKERYICSALIGIFFIFTKETALLLFPLVPALALLCYPQRRSSGKFKHAATALLLPFAFFAIYAIHKTEIRGLPLFWNQLGGDVELFWQLINIFSFDKRLLAQLIQGFILSFQWVLSIILIVLFVLYFLKLKKTATKTEHRNVVFIIGLFVTVLYLVTRFRPYSNPRYLLPFYPVFLILLFQLTTICIRNRYARIALLVSYLLLFIPSLYLTLDPLSKRIFGTFNFGRHKMLKMTSIAQEYDAGFGRDQLVYNLQFVQFHYMQDYVYGKLKPKPETIFMLPFDLWITEFTRQLRRDNYRRTVSKNNNEIFRPRYYTIQTFPGNYKDVKEVYYFEYPNVENNYELTLLSTVFKHRQIQAFEHNGYALMVTRFYH